MGLRDGTELVKVCAGSNHEKMHVLESFSSGITYERLKRKRGEIEIKHDAMKK